MKKYIVVGLLTFSGLLTGLSAVHAECKGRNFADVRFGDWRYKMDLQESIPLLAYGSRCEL